MVPLSADASNWVEAQFKGVELGDERRNRRLVCVAKDLAERPNGTLPSSFATRAGLKASYRLLSSDDVSYEQVIRQHVLMTRKDCEKQGEFLLLQDTTTLDFSTHPMTKGLGRIGNDGGYGMLLHTALAVRVESWTVQDGVTTSMVGLAGQMCWTRKGKAKRQVESRMDRLRRHRESMCWTEVLQDVGRAPTGVKWTVIGDRGADLYELFEYCQAQDLQFVVRACSSRSLASEDAHSFDVVKQAPVLGSFTLRLRARPGVRARTAQLEVRSCSVTVRGAQRIGGRRPPIMLNVIDVSETSAPRGVNPLHWVLYTSLPCASFEDVLRCVHLYEKRWLIEEYHKALKTGTAVEKSQLSTAERLKNLLGILAVVAVWLLGLKLIAAVHPDEAASSTFLSPAAKAVLEAKKSRPLEGWTNKTLLVAIAMIGGFLGRNSDGLPGWQTLWRGWQRLELMAEGAQLMSERNK